MSETGAARTAPSETNAPSVDRRPEASIVVPPRRDVDSGPRRWTAGRVTALAIGSVLVLVAVVLLGGGGTALWADRTQRDPAGYITTDVHRFSTSGSALVTERTDLGTAGTGWLYSPGVLDEARIRVVPAKPGSTLFVGIGPSVDVDRYLAGVSQTLIADFWTGSVESVGGGSPESAPASQNFWVASDTGTGTRTVTWDPTAGSWTVVVMNADTRPGVDVRADLGAWLPAVPWIGVGLLAGGAIFLIGGVLFIRGATRRRETNAVT